MAKKKITETGPKGLRGLQGINRKLRNSNLDFSPEFKDEIINDYSSLAKKAYYSQRGKIGQESWTNPGVHEAQRYRPDEPEFHYGESSYDTGIIRNMDPITMQNNRAENQSWYAKVGAGLAKGAVLALTTFLDGTIGLVTGGIKAIDEGRWSALWDNDFSKTMQAFNQWAEEVMPNYYSTKEEDTPWYENIFTANFLGDKFLKNLGFTIGAFYSGGIEAAGIKGLGALAKGFAKTTEAIKNITNATKMVASAVGATTSAVNEGRIEALNNSTDWYKLKTQELNERFLQQENKIREEYEANKGSKDAEQTYLQQMEQLKTQREQSLAQLNEDRLKMGNADLLMNLPILMASNIIQFGKMYANGFKTGKKAMNIFGKPGSYEGGTTKAMNVWRATKGALSEGVEEISQSAASRIAGNYYSKDVDNFVKSKLDPRASQETLNWIKEFALGINETVNDGSAWEEFFIGSLTGALGMPKFRGIRNKEGNLQSPITIEGGMINELKESRDARKREQEIADRMNQRFASPEFKNYYQGLTRHRKYQNDMDDAVERNDPFDYHNADHAQMVSDIIMWDKAGKLQDLQELIDSAYDTSDENLASIVKNTTAQTEDGKTVGPFIDENGNPKYATEEGKQEMIKQLTETKDKISDAIRKYQKSKEDIQARLPEDVELSDDQLEELVWMKSQIDNWKERAVSMSGEVKTSIGKVIGSLEATHNLLSDIRTEEGKNNADLTPLYKQTDKSIKELKKAIDTLNTTRNLSDEDLAEGLARNPEFVKGLIAEIDKLDDATITEDERQDIKQKLNDIVKLGNGRKEYAKKYKEFVIDPYLRKTGHEDLIRQAEEDQQAAKTAGLKNNLYNSQSLKDFKNALSNDEELEPEEKEALVKQMAENGHKLAKDYMDTEDYARQVRRELTNSGIDSQVFSDAMSLLQNQQENSENLTDISNIDSVNLSDDTFFEEDSGSIEQAQQRFTNAQAALAEAMRKVNNSANFKNRFVQPVDQSDTDEENTNTGRKLPIMIPPKDDDDDGVGDIESNDLHQENKTLNDQNSDTPPTRSSQPKKYWRPAIPQLDIEGSKQGDFRPFNVVIKEVKPGSDYDALYDYLEQNNAFDFVNKGGLKPNDVLSFMIDPEFEKKVEGSPWHTEPVIFIVTESGQIVGSLDQGSSVLNFPGLRQLRDKIIQEYNNRPKQDQAEQQSTEASDEFKERVNNPDSWDNIDIESLNAGELEAMDNALMSIISDSNQSDELREKARNIRSNRFVERLNNRYTQQSNQSGNKFVATPRTKVSKIMIGKVPTTNEDRSLKDIPKVRGENGNQEPVFGVIKNGRMSTNGKIPANQVINPVDMSNKEGRLYLLIPNGAGTYSPMAVRVKHFNNSEFNIDDPTIQATAVGRDINNAITELANAQSSEDIQTAKATLAKNLYMRDVMITWFEARDGGVGIVISKKVRDANGHPVMVEINGQQHIKEAKSTIYFGNKKDVSAPEGVLIDPSAFNAMGIAGGEVEFNNPEDIRKQIINVLTGYNLPIQVSARKINSRGYNNRLINSNILTSNLASAETLSNWFTMDYIDEDGNIQPADNPPSVIPPTSSPSLPEGAGDERGLDSIVSVSLGDKNLEVNLQQKTIRENGKWRNATNADQLIMDLAWAQSVYGDRVEGLYIHNNCVITPNDMVLDRTNKKYLLGDDAKKVRDIIEAKIKTRDEANRRADTIIAKINENQKRVDKERTDSNYYYIQEDDGEFHEYDRIHKRLGDNWHQTDEQKNALNQTRIKLQQKVDNEKAYNQYLKNLSNYYKVDLSAFEGKTSARDRDSIVQIISDKMNSRNSARALKAGNAVDRVVREFFMTSDPSQIQKPEELNQQAFNSLMTRLTQIKQTIDSNGWRFLTNNIVLFHKYPDGTRIAGEVDILAVTNEGKFAIFDVKTSRNPFGEFINDYNKKVNYFENKSKNQDMSNKDYYTLQVSGYQNLFESQYQEDIEQLGLVPFHLVYSKSEPEKVDNINAENVIMLTYNPAINSYVPTTRTKKQEPAKQQPQQGPTPAQPQSKPKPQAPSQPANATNKSAAFVPHPNINSTDMLQEHNKFTTKNNTTGYYIVGNEVKQGYMVQAGKINGVDVFIAREAITTAGFGREQNHVAGYDYYAVFPNGEAVPVMKGVTVQTETECINSIVQALNNNPGKVSTINARENVLTKDINKEESNEFTSSPSVQQDSTQQPAAQNTPTLAGISKASPATKRTRPKLRESTSSNIPVWDQNKELAKLREMLPQLTRNDGIRIINGLIKVAENGATAWGQMEDGVITLSDIAAEGTAYHEAFHLLFNHILDDVDRSALLKEAAKRFGNNLNNEELEEELAEEFREFVMSDGKDTRSLGRKIIDFFKSLFALVNNWSKLRPSSIYYYRALSQGKYANKEIKNTSTTTKYSREKYTPEMLNILAHAPRDAQGRLLAPNGKPSNLTERQYAQVRTKAFKEWFGDWEKVWKIANSAVTHYNNRDEVKKNPSKTISKPQSVRNLTDVLNELWNELDLSIDVEPGFTMEYRNQIQNDWIDSIAWYLTDKNAIPEGTILFEFVSGDNNAAGFRSTLNGVIGLNKDFTYKKDALTTLLHEIIHSTTIAAFNDPKTEAEKLFKDKLTKLYKYCKNYINTHQDIKAMRSLKDRYGMTDEYEFIAELANPSFIGLLKHLRVDDSYEYFEDNKKYIDEKSKDKDSVFSQIVSALKQFIDALFVTRSKLKGNEWQLSAESATAQLLSIWDEYLSNSGDERHDVFYKFTRINGQVDYTRMRSERPFNNYNVSRAVDENGEPKVFYHYTDDVNLNEFSPDFDNYFTKEGGTKNAFFFTEDKVEPGSEDNFLTSRKRRIDVFLNIRNLEEHQGTKEDLHKKGTTYRQVVNESAKRNPKTGGLHFSGFDDNRKEDQDIWIVHNPNQVKSATDNVGTFSKTNNDIRYRRVIGDRVANWNRLNQEQKRLLEKKKWTEEHFNRISQKERDQVMKCLA